MTTLIFGGSGFIGLNIAEALLARGERVLLFDRAAPPAFALAELRLTAPRGELTMVLGDVCDVAAVAACCRRAGAEGPFDVVFGAAITADAARDASEPERVLQVNLLSIVHALRAARESGLRRIVNLSSVAAYGESVFGAAPLVEDVTPAAPVGLYAITKFASERVLDRLAGLWKLDALSVRLSGVFGPWERPTGARDTLSPFFQMLALAHAGAPALLPREGLRDWVYAPDIARAVCALLAAPSPKARLYNITGAPAFSVLEWGARLAALWPGFTCRLARPGETPNVDLHGGRDRAALSSDRLAGEFGVRAQYGCEAAAAHLAAWARRFPQLWTER